MGPLQQNIMGHIWKTSERHTHGEKLRKAAARSKGQTYIMRSLQAIKPGSLTLKSILKAAQRQNPKVSHPSVCTVLRRFVESGQVEQRDGYYLPLIDRKEHLASDFKASLEAMMRLAGGPEGFIPLVRELCLCVGSDDAEHLARLLEKHFE